MALRDFFKKVPEGDLDRRQSLRDPEQILAWLEELSRLGTALELECSESDLTPLQAKVRLVAEDTGTVSFAFKWKPAKEFTAGQKVRLVFPLDRQRFQTDLVYQGRGNYLEYRFHLPTAIYHAERRDAIRVKMRPRDELNIIVLQGFFDGLGLTGTLVDLSIGGCCFLVQRALQIKGERRLPISVNLLAPGTALVLVRLPNLPHLPQVECGGYVCSMRAGSEGVVVGVRFEGLGGPETAVLTKFLSERDPGIAIGFPRKHRRREEDATEAETQSVVRAVEAAAPEVAPTEAGTAIDPLDEADDALPGGRPEAGFLDPASEIELMKRLHKRGKKILLAMSDELERISLLAQLQHDGYRSLFEAQSLVQALEHHRRVPLDLVVLDQSVGHMGALKLLDVLRENGLPKETPVVVMQKTVDHQLTLARKGGRVNLLVERPLDYDAAMKLPLEGLLKL